MSKQYELLDSLLAGAGQQSSYVQENAQVSNDEGGGFNDKFYATMDKLAESAMRENLCDTIMESDNSESEKLQHLKVVNEAVFNEDQVLTFMQENVTPLLELASWETKAELSELEVVPVAVYETALALEMAANWDELKEDASLYESVLNSVEMTDEILEEHIGDIFDSYEIEEEDRETVVENVVEFLEEKGIDCMVPDFNELSEMLQIVGPEFLDEGKKKSAAKVVYDGSKPGVLARAGARIRKLVGQKNTKKIEKFGKDVKEKGRTAYLRAKNAAGYSLNRWKRRGGEAKEAVKNAAKYVGGKAKAAKGAVAGQAGRAWNAAKGASKNKWVRRGAVVGALGAAAAGGYAATKKKKNVKEVVEFLEQMSDGSAHYNVLIEALQS